MYPFGASNAGALLGALGDVFPSATVHWVTTEKCFIHISSVVFLKEKKKKKMGGHKNRDKSVGKQERVRSEGPKDLEREREREREREIVWCMCVSAREKVVEIVLEEALVVCMLRKNDL